MGNNFAAPEGGSIFLQDIRVDGGMDCAGSESYRPFDFQEPASAGEYPKLVDPIDLPPFGTCEKEEWLWLLNKDVMKSSVFAEEHDLMRK